MTTQDIYTLIDTIEQQQEQIEKLKDMFNYLDSEIQLKNQCACMMRLA